MQWLPAAMLFALNILEFRRKTIAAGSHCMTPKFLKIQLGRSLKNLASNAWTFITSQSGGRSSLNFKEEFPEPPCARLSRFSSRPWRPARFSITAWATWNGFRQAAERARRAAARGNRADRAGNCGRQAPLPLRALPFNLAMTEALTWQSIAARASSHGDGSSQRTGITLIASASLLQGQVAKNLPKFVAERSAENDAERALHFARSSPELRPRWWGCLAWNT